MDQPAPGSSPDHLPVPVPSAESVSPAPPVDSLPEEDPLTPEILEDEAIRGDFVLRWVVVALAVLLGCSQLNDARTLVHVRSGEWLAAHGYLPKGHDPFSLTTADRTWIQLDWLFDLLAATIHSLAGPIGLSLSAGAVTAGIFALVVQSHRRDIRTWWTAVCATLALLASYDRFDFTPPLFTLLGVAAVLALITHVENTGTYSRLWWLVPVMAIWSQFSSQAWIGGAIMVLYGVGTMLDRPRIADEPLIALPPGTLFVPAMVGLLVMLVHPFSWHTWEAAWQQYTVEYPSWRQIYPRPVVIDLVWYPLWSKLVWTQWTHRLIAGVTLAIVAGICLLLNRRRLSWSHSLLYIGGNALGLAALHDLPAASLINAVLAGIHAQEWYHDRFGQIYTVARAEVFFSRAGRALTLFAFFALAWTIISGRLDGPDGRRTGVGLSRALQVELETYRQLPQVTFDDRGFHTTVRQGDLLIAAGRKSVVDRRVMLFTGAGDSNLLSWFERVRKGFLPAISPEEAAEQRALRKEAMEHFQLSHVVFRLLHNRDEAGLPVLLAAEDWSLTDLLPTAAVFHPLAANDLERKTFATTHAFNPIAAAFRTRLEPSETPIQRPVPPLWSQQLVSVPRGQHSASTALARHYLYLGRLAQRAPWSFQMGCYHLAVRTARTGIREDATQVEPYRILGEAYAAIAQLEGLAFEASGIPWRRSLRYYEAAAALQEAVRLNPDSIESWGLLLDLYEHSGQIDAALSALRQFMKLTPLPPDATDAAIQDRRRMHDHERQMESAVERVTKEIERLRESQTDVLTLAALAHQNGCVEMAVTLLQGDAVTLERNPLARQILTLWLAELGRGEVLDDSSERLEIISRQLPGWSWRNPLGYAALSRGDYHAAVQLWTELPVEISRVGLQSILETTSLTRSSPVFLGDFQFPGAHLAAAQQTLERLPYESVEASLQAGCCEIERGNPEAAIAAFRLALKTDPESPLRPLLRLYLYCLTDELIDYEPPSDWIPHSVDVFAPEESMP